MSRPFSHDDDQNDDGRPEQLSLFDIPFDPPAGQLTLFDGFEAVEAPMHEPTTVNAPAPGQLSLFDHGTEQLRLFDLDDVETFAVSYPVIDAGVTAALAEISDDLVEETIARILAWGETWSGRDAH